MISVPFGSVLEGGDSLSVAPRGGRGKSNARSRRVKLGSRTEATTITMSILCGGRETSRDRSPERDHPVDSFRAGEQSCPARLIVLSSSHGGIDGANISLGLGQGCRTSERTAYWKQNASQFRTISSNLPSELTAYAIGQLSEQTSHCSALGSAANAARRSHFFFHLRRSEKLSAVTIQGRGNVKFD